MSGKKTERDWQLNCWTGDYILRVSPNARVVRMAGRPPYLYKGEDWGDHSLAYPKDDGWRPTLGQALADIERLQTPAVTV